MFKVTEALIQVFSGTVIIFLSNIILFPVIGIEATVQMNATLVIINTVVSFVKSYVVRHIFYKLENK